MRKKTRWVICGVLGIALVLAGCTNAQKQATEAAINAAQAALDAARSEAEKYVPEQLQVAQTALQNAKDALAKGDYQGALRAAQDSLGKAKDLSAATAAQKDELKKAWDSVNETVTKSLNAVKVKLDAYSRGAHMPTGMDKTKLAEAKEQYARLKQQWADATATAQQNLRDAVKEASSLKDELARLMEELGIKSKE